MSYASPANTGGKPADLRDHLTRRATAMKQERSTWDPHWRDIADHMRPQRSRFLTTKTNKGDRRNQSIIDNTAVIASRVLSAGMMSGMSSPARPWFKYEPNDLDLLEYGPVKLWLGKLERLTRRIFSESNVYNALPIIYDEVGLFGTGCALIEDDFEDVIRLAPFTVGEYCLALNERRTVDTLYREMRMTVLQVVQMFGLKNVSATVRSQYDASSYDQWVDVCHMIEPNKERDTSKKDAANMTFRSVYWEPNCKEKQFLRKSGYPSNPIIAPRWDVVGNDIYGRSPGMDALSDTRQLQIQQKRKGEAIDKVVRPPLQGSPSVQDRYVNQLPGGMTIVADMNANSGVKPLYEVRPDIGALREDMDDTRQRIREAFFVPQFLAISQMEGVQPRNQFELAERKEEKLLMLGPVVERLQNEMHNPLINRTVERIIEVSMAAWENDEAGMIEPPPPELQGSPLAITYISTLAQVQKGVALQGIERTMAFVTGVSELFPEAKDKIDIQQAVDEIADMMGVPASMIRPDEEVAALNEARQNQQQMQQMAAMAPVAKDAAGAAKALSETQVGEGRNALEAMMGN